MNGGAATRGGRLRVGVGVGVLDVAFAAAFLVAGMGVSVELWARDPAYFADVAREARLDDQRFHFGAGDRQVPLADLLGVDARVRPYVLGGDQSPLRIRLAGEPFFNEREAAHLRDVRAVLGGVGPATAAAALALLAGLWLERRRIARAALVDAALVVALGVAAALLFEPLFLLFHEVFFPQGNFLFDPARDNLVVLYPESYWLGVTLRVGATFVLMALFVAVLARVPIGFAGRSQEGRPTTR